MPFLKRFVSLLLIASLFGCGQSATFQYGAGGSTDATLQWSTGGNSQTTQGVGFQGTGTGTSSNQSTTAASGGGPGAAAVIAVIGLIALVLLADDFAACTGIGCDPDNQRVR